MSFLSALPTEIVYSISKNLMVRRDISALARTCRAFFDILIHQLYLHNQWWDECDVLDWAILHDREDTLKRAIECGLSCGMRQLSSAACGGKFAMTEFLLGCQTVRDELKGNPEATQLLTDTISERNMSIAMLLLEAEPTIAKTFFLRRITCEHLPLLRLLLDNGASVNAVETRNGNTPLHLSIRPNRSRLEATMLLLNKGADVNVQNHEGLTPLHLAAAYGWVDVAAALVDAGANMETHDEKGRSPLLYGAQQRKGIRFVMADFLLKSGADPLAVDSLGWSVLHEATRSAKVDFVRLLLESGADVSVTNSKGQTPLGVAAHVESPEIFRMLISHGADLKGQAARYVTTNLEIVQIIFNHDPSLVNIWDTESTLLHLALKEDCHETARFLIEQGASVTARDMDENIPLHLAAAAGDIELCKLLLMNGSELEPTNDDNRTPLHLALYRKHDEVAKIFIERHANLTIRDRFGFTPLLQAAKNCSAETVELLIANGADVNCAGGYSPLYHAYRSHDGEVLNVLLAHGADPNIGGYDERTALFLSSYNGDYAITEQLLRHGADAKKTDIHGDTPLTEAVRGGHLETVKVLIENGAIADWTDPMGARLLHLAVESANLDLLDFLLEQGIDVNQSHRDKGTALMMAAQLGNMAIVDRLLQVGADATIGDDDYHTALDHAASSRKCDIVQRLIDHGVDCDAVDPGGYTPLFKAIHRGTIDTVRLLLHNRADPNGREMVKKDTPLCNAVRANNRWLVRLLLQYGASPLAADNHGISPLDARGDIKPYELRTDPEIVRLLIKCGAVSAGKSPTEDE